MKKNYHAPQLKAFVLQGGSLMLNQMSVNPKETTDKGSWSKEFWGLVEDDEEDEAEFPWE